MNRIQLSWKQLTSLKIGGAICLPVIMAGHALCQSYGLASALAAVSIGNMILLIIALVMAKMSFETGLTTTDNGRTYFGERGSQLFACALIVMKTCWIAIQIGLMAVSLKVLLPDAVPLSLLHIVLGALVIAVPMYGIGLLSRWTTWSLPMLILTMLYALYVQNGGTPEEGMTVFTIEGISFAMATAISAVVDMPTYFRHAKSQKEGLLAALLFIGVGVPLIEGVGIYLCYLHPGATVVDTLRQGDSPVWNLWVTLFLVLAGWSTNNSNLYSAVAGIGTLLPHHSEKRRTLTIGCVGIALSLCGILESFTTVLQFLGVLVASMGCILLTRYLNGENSPDRKLQQPNLVIWVCSAALGLCSTAKWIALTGIPLIDACLAATLFTFTSSMLNFIKKSSTMTAEGKI